MNVIHTFSIVAYDPTEEAWGVGVASKFLAAASVVSWAQAAVGAIATQAYGKVSFGIDGLKLLADGLSAEETLAKLIASDPESAHRQVGIVDKQGGVAAHTGAECFEWAGHRLGKNYTCQGNILANEQVLAAMASAYESAQGELADRLAQALLAADGAGGDKRGKQSAGVLVVRPKGGYGGDNDRYLDLRVDDDPHPIPKLIQMIHLHHLYFGEPDPQSLLPLDADLVHELQDVLKRLGYYTGDLTGVWDKTSREAFWVFCGIENLEERAEITYEADEIDPIILNYIRERFDA